MVKDVCDVKSKLTKGKPHEVGVFERSACLVSRVVLASASPCLLIGLLQSNAEQSPTAQGSSMPSLYNRLWAFLNRDHNNQVF